jgi:hypothetical protein
MRTHQHRTVTIITIIIPPGMFITIRKVAFTIGMTAAIGIPEATSRMGITFTRSLVNN